MDFVAQLFKVSDFNPRWSCGVGWKATPAYGWLHVVSDLGVWSAYLAIPCVLAYFILKRRDIPFRTIFLLFAAFILACGTTHLMDALIFWWPAYRLAAVIKLGTAIVSWGTVFALIPVVPMALSLRSPKELEREIAARKQAEEELRRTNAELERRVTERTTELTEAAAALRQQAEEMRTLLATIPVGVLIAHDTECRVITGNPAAHELLRTPQENLSKSAPADELPRNFKVYRNGVELPPEQMPVQRAARGEQIRNEEIDDVFDDGTTLHTLISAAPLYDAQGRVRGAVASVQDVSDHKRAEEAVREADRRKTEFLAILAHELRNPLAPIRNGLQIMRMAGTQPSTLEEVREMMERQLSQMVRLVDDLLDVSRISRGKLELRKERVELAHVLQSALEASEPMIEEMGHRLELDLPAERLMVEADLTRLSQVFMNLLNNAAKYSERNGRVRLSARGEGTQAVITVQDEGIGLASDQLPQLFQMFSQGDRSRSRGGLGIGLSLVKNLLEMHGGTIEARSDGPGRGSEFTVRLPIVETEAPLVRTPDTKEPRATSSLRILVVDDNRDGADSLSTMLRVVGNETRTAYDGAQAVEAWQSFQPDAILLDIGLPKMDGHQVCRWIRSQPGGRDVIIIAQTGWGQAEDRQRTHDAGFDHHLVKPIDPVGLMKLLKTLPGRG